ncbi:MAG: LLM class flavin-dependent oxidoreductase, partial [Chloroflexi bacterium]
DHFTNASGPDKDSLELWTSLTFAATFTQRIEFGPLVTPITFRHPSMTARYAAAVDDLSGGRLVLGMGAGWQEREHKKFGVPFYDFPTRYAMLREGLDVVTSLLQSDEPVSYQGKYFSLEDAQLLPRPQRKGGPPLLIGGNGPKRTLPLVAQYASEWNAVYIQPDIYPERSQQLDELLRQQGRQPQDVKRSLMTQVIYESDPAALEARVARYERTPEELIARGLIVGNAEQIVEQIGQWVERGVQRFMLQWLNQDDIDGLEQLAKHVLPHFHTD